MRERERERERKRESERRERERGGERERERECKMQSILILTLKMQSAALFPNLQVMKRLQNSCWFVVIFRSGKVTCFSNSVMCV